MSAVRVALWVMTAPQVSGSSAAAAGLV